MPRRWLSVRGRKEEQNANQEIGEAYLQNDFDFAFAAEQHVQGGSHEPATPDVLRPTTSGGERYKAKRKPDLTLLIDRPKSSDSIIPNKTLSAARLDDSQIGVALGSPRHPPQVVESIASTMSSTQHHQAYLLEGPLPPQPAKGKRWKIGEFFRPRGNSNKEPTFYQVHQVDAVETKKLGLPIKRNPWRNPRSPPIAQDGFEDQTSSTIGRDDSNVVLLSTSPAKHNTQHTDSSRLEINVPGTPLERYSVMFKDVNGVTQSGLLVRRSKDLDQLLIATDLSQKSSELVVPKLNRRATSPTTSKHPDTSRTHNNSSASSKYSLFPSTPTSIRFLSQTDSPDPSRNRSATGPPQLSSSQATFSAPQAHRTGSHQQSALSTQQCKHSTDLNTVGDSVTADHSRVPSQTEIFFDVKSFRDSRGQVGQQFEMTRPPSAVVQLARSQSSARRLLQEKLNGKPHVQNPVTSEDRVERSTSLQIDETIAIVESLTSPSGPDSTLQRLPQTTYSPELMHDGRSGEAEEKVYAMDTESASTKKLRRKSELRSRLDGLNIDVPSPVLEQVEETTPRTTRSISPEGLPQKKPTHTVQAISPPISPSSSPKPLSNTPSPPPPALPIKDSKYIPLSKYAPKRTTDDLVRQTGLRPVRLSRSNTDSVTTWNARSSSLRRPPCPERSSTMPPLDPTSHSKYTNNLHPPVVAGPGTKSSGPSMVAYIKPAAEVSIARTVSLSRRPSARVVGSKLPTRTASRKGQPQEEVKEKKVALGIPVVQEVHKGHKPGLSQEVVLETATIAPSSPPPPMPSPSILLKQPTEPPPAPPVDAH